MPEFHAEPYLYLAGPTHKAALIAWGGFYFHCWTISSSPNGLQEKRQPGAFCWWTLKRSRCRSRL